MQPLAVPIWSHTVAGDVAAGESERAIWLMLVFLSLTKCQKQMMTVNNQKSLDEHVPRSKRWSRVQVAPCDPFWLTGRFYVV